MYFFQKLRRNSSFKIAPFYVLISLTLWGLPTSGNTQALGKASLISPRNNVAVKNGRPCFEWHAAEGAEKYTVQVSSDTVFGPSSKRWVLNDVRSTRQCWNASFRPNPTAGETPDSLYPEATYYWRIKSEREGSSWVFSDYRPFRVPSESL